MLERLFHTGARTQAMSALKKVESLQRYGSVVVSLSEGRRVVVRGPKCDFTFFHLKV